MSQRRLGWSTGTHSDDDNVLDQHHHGASQQSRGSVSGLSVFAEDVDEEQHGALMHGKQADQKILDHANFGVVKLQLRSGKSATRRTSTNVISAAQREIRRRSSDLAISWKVKLQQGKWKHQLVQLLLLLRLLDSLYILFSVPLRLGFFFDPWNHYLRRTTWTRALSVFTVLDLAGVLIRVWFARKELLPMVKLVGRSVASCCGKSQQVHPSNRPRYLSMIRASFIGEADMLSLRSQGSVVSVRGDSVSAADTLPFRHRSKFATKIQRYAVFTLLGTVVKCIPLELLTICMVGNYNALHFVGITRFAQAAVDLPRSFSDAVLARYRHVAVIQALAFSTVAAIVYLFVAGVYLVHAAASGYMFLAHWECGLEFRDCPSTPLLPGSWVQRDHLEGGTLTRQYIRSLYWGSKTVTTLGQGDLVPATEAETVYRILVQFISGLWATAILTAYSFYFSRKDATMTTNITTRLEQATNVRTATRCITDPTI